MTFFLASLSRYFAIQGLSRCPTWQSRAPHRAAVLAGGIVERNGADIYKVRLRPENLGVYAVQRMEKGRFTASRKASQELYEVFAIFVGAGGQRSQPEHRRKTPPRPGRLPERTLLPNIRPSPSNFESGYKMRPNLGQAGGIAAAFTNRCQPPAWVKGAVCALWGCHQGMPYIPTDWTGQAQPVHTGWFRGRQRQQSSSL